MIYNQPPLQEIRSPLLTDRGIKLLVLREDLNHPTVPGNKWWKLKYNLKQAQEEGAQVLVSFGGAYSNHIYALASAALDLGVRSVGFIRGEEVSNPILDHAAQCGMELRFVDRTTYRDKASPLFIQKIYNEYPHCFIIPEGGTNDLAVRGVIEWAKSLGLPGVDYLFMPVGTGGTMAGFIAGTAPHVKVCGISVLRNASYLEGRISSMLADFGSDRDEWLILHDYHHGGYARTSPALLQFIHHMKTLHELPLEPVYTGKMFYALFKEIEKGTFPVGSTLLAIHTGGLQNPTRYD